MPDLPAIVEAIRQQRPGVVPEWLVFHRSRSCRTDSCFKDTRNGVEYEDDAAQSIIEAALWRAYMKSWNPLLLDWDGRPGQPGIVGWYTDSIRKGRTVHGTGQFALVRALCHAIGIEAPDA